MSNLVLTDAKIWLGQFNVSGVANEVEMNWSAEMCDVTTFGQTTRINKPGLFNVEGSVKGYNDYDDTQAAIDLALKNLIGAAAAPMSIAPQGNAEGDVAYTLNKVTGSYRPLAGSVGECAPFEIDAKGGGGPLVKGVVGGTGAKVATGNTGTGQLLGAASAAQKIYAAVHVLAVSGTTPSMTVTIESATVVGFGSPTTRLTFNAMTAVGAQFLSALGPVTDTFWRAKWTISGTTPSFTVFIVLGIGPK